MLHRQLGDFEVQPWLRVLNKRFQISVRGQKIWLENKWKTGTVGLAELTESELSQRQWLEG
jgi:hypothetical protein